jgi:hypothetical protein
LLAASELSVTRDIYKVQRWLEHEVAHDHREVLAFRLRPDEADALSVAWKTSPTRRSLRRRDRKRASGRPDRHDRPNGKLTNAKRAMNSPNQNDGVTRSSRRLRGRSIGVAKQLGEHLARLLPTCLGDPR